MWQVGDKIGRLTVESVKPIKLRCDCGKLAAYSFSHVVNNRVRSCGCLRTENVVTYVEGQEVAGMRLLRIVMDGPAMERRWLVTDGKGQRVITEVYLKTLERRARQAQE